VPFIAISFTFSAPALVWLTFADSRAALAAAAFLLGFFMTSALPVGMQYSAEITAPVPEGTSNGMIQLAGQTSVVVVYLMAVTRTSSGSFVPSLCALAVLLLVCGVVVSRLPEPARHLERTSGAGPAGDTTVHAATS
jgi:MFS-type transporter involved in bile tolerance (Atg22 family)